MGKHKEQLPKNEMYLWGALIVMVVMNLFWLIWAVTYDGMIL